MGIWLNEGGSGPANFVRQAAGLSVTADGAVGYDTTGDRVVWGGAGGIAGFGLRLLSSQWSANDSLIAATISTTETAFGQFFNVPASFWTGGKSLLVMAGFEVTTSAGAPTLQPRVRLAASGVTTNLYVAGAQAQNSLASVGCGQIWLIQGTAAPGASVALETLTFSPIGLQGLTGRNTLAQPQNAATNSAQSLQITLQYGANTAGNNVTMRQFHVLEIG